MEMHTDVQEYLREAFLTRNKREIKDWNRLWFEQLELERLKLNQIKGR